jgi:hypothetical protein
MHFQEAKKKRGGESLTITKTALIPKQHYLVGLGN